MGLSWEAEETLPASSFLLCLVFQIEGFMSMASHHPSIVLSHGKWKRGEAADPAAVVPLPHSHIVHCSTSSGVAAALGGWRKAEGQLPAPQLPKPNPPVFLLARLASHLHISRLHLFQPKFKFLYFTFYLVASSLPLSHH